MVKDVDQKFADIRDSLLNTLQKVESILNDSQTITLDEYLKKQFEKRNHGKRYSVLIVCKGEHTQWYTYSLDKKEELLRIVKRLLVWYPMIQGIQITNLETGEEYWSKCEENVQDFIDFLNEDKDV